MSRKVNHALFDLIQSMTKSEKRYFKIHASRHTIGETNNYVLLFDFIDKQEEYDEDTIQQNFKGQAFLNRFSITKKRLYDQILASLDSFHTSSSIEAQLFKQLHSADILFKKSLYDQCKRVLLSIEKSAIKYEFQSIVIEVAKRKKKIIETEGYLNFNEKEINELLCLEVDSINELSAMNRLWGIKTNLFIKLAKSGVARTPIDVAAYNSIVQSVLLEQMDNLSEHQKFIINHIKGAYYFAINDFKKSLDQLKLNLELCKSSKILTLEPNKYISVLTNLIYIADKLGESNTAISALNELKQFSNKVDLTEDLEIKIFSSVTSIDLSLLLRKGSFVEAADLANEIVQKLERFGSKISPLRRLYLEFKLAITYMGLGEHREALKWTNSILNNSNLDQSEDLISFTQLINLLVHIELGNNEFISYCLKQTQRFLKTRNRMYNFEEVFLQFIGQLIKTNDRFDAENLWENLYHQLAQMEEDNESTAIAMDYFDFKAWAEAKLKRKEFSLVLKEHYNEKLAS